MTEWDAAAYSRISALQRWQAEKSLAALQLEGGERVLDVGCGNGVITAQLAARLPRGAVVGVDASRQMIDFAAETFPPCAHPNLTFRVADAARLAFVDEFDLIVSFNCLRPRCAASVTPWCPPDAPICASCRRAHDNRWRT